MRVLVFGDSITQGFWDIDGGWVTRVRKDYDQQMINGLNDDPPAFLTLEFREIAVMTYWRVSKTKPGLVRRRSWLL